MPSALIRFQSAQQGNILFLILIAVALFAALSFAITQSTRSGGADVSKEKTQLLVDQLSQYSAVIANAITRVILNNGCTINTIDFRSQLWALDEYDIRGASGGPPSPSSGFCDIFSQNGGAVIWQAPPVEAVPVAGGQYAISGRVAIQGVGTTDNELLLALEVTRAVCIRANEQDGAQNPGGNPPVLNDPNSRFETPIANWKAFGPFTIDNNGGNRFPGFLTVGSPGNAPELNGHQMGCYETSPGTGIYVFYQVLMPR